MYLNNLFAKEPSGTVRKGGGGREGGVKGLQAIFNLQIRH